MIAYSCPQFSVGGGTTIGEGSCRKHCTSRKRIVQRETKSVKRHRLVHCRSGNLAEWEWKVFTKRKPRCVCQKARR